MQERKLNGYYLTRQYHPFTLKNWFNASYQDSTEKYLSDHVPLKASFVRIRNQVDYLFFEKLYAENVRLEKNGHFFRYTSYFVDGSGYKNDSIIIQNVKALKNVQAKLSLKGKQLVFVIAPDKIWIYRDHLKDETILNPKSTAFYNRYCYYLKKYQCSFIDLNSAFIDWRKQKKGLLFSKGGYHWTEFGAFLGVDSIYRYLQNRYPEKLPYPEKISFDVNEKPWARDRDMMDACNLQFIPSLDEEYTHPQITGLKEEFKSNALLTGDSFCHAVWYSKVFIKYFKESSVFWYYNREVYRYEDDKMYQPGDLKEKEFFKNTDFYIVLYSAGNLEYFDYGFLTRFQE